MQDPRMLASGEGSKPKPRKKKTSASTSKFPLIQLQGNDGQQRGTGQKAAKRNSKNEQQQERSNFNSLPDSSTPGNEYHALIRKYLLLEEENVALETELKEAEDSVKTLEDEKLALLDQLVVLEGLITPSELQHYLTNL